MLERLQTAADRQADRLLVRVIRNLSNRRAPLGVEVSPLPDGVALTGNRLRTRLIEEPALRNFWK